MRKTISLVMATYNGARFLREQLDSIYNQTLLPDEIIVCDDCSTDGTVDILKEYSKERGLKYYVNEKSLGVNGNFYKAMSLATCDYIAICDQDDIWLPEKIETTYKKLCEIDDGKPCVVSSLCNHIDAEGNITSNLPDEPDTCGYAATLLGQNSQGCSLMLNRELLFFVLQKKDALSAQNIIYDAFISFIGASIGEKYNIGKRLMLYRHHENNVLSKAVSKKASIRERIRRKPELVGLMPDTRMDRMPAFLEAISGYEKDGDVKDFVTKAASVSKNKSFVNKMQFVSSLKEISCKRKIHIIMVSTILHLVKYIIR